MKPLLFDTNLIVALVRSENFKNNFEKTYPFHKNETLISTVTQGELQSVVIQWKWGHIKSKRLAAILERFIIYPIKVQNIIEAYAKIDAYSQGKLSGQPLPNNMSSRNMGKNDLWIAATAHVTNATLISSDKDFAHLDGVFLDLDWVDIEGLK
ncbi:MAG TPA: type II toxin-antitoxin system VapC family toxin [Bacteroidetes bacterium]|nr:type II toxin-antitoxin system VapC family toxin [Bacteroidota bacterium]